MKRCFDFGFSLDSDVGGTGIYLYLINLDMESQNMSVLRKQLPVQLFLTTSHLWQERAIALRSLCIPLSLCRFRVASWETRSNQVEIFIPPPKKKNNQHKMAKPVAEVDSYKHSLRPKYSPRT